MLIAVFILIALALRALYLQIWLRNSTPIRYRREGWLVCELRRRVGMERVPNQEFPVPREERIRVFRLFGLVLWHDEMSVALPNTACECFDKVAPQDFDRDFPRWLQLNPAV